MFGLRADEKTSAPCLPRTERHRGRESHPKVSLLNQRIRIEVELYAGRGVWSNSKVHLRVF
jgi:hypothetical protein